MPPARHAIYFAPAAEHPLWQAGCAWLGRDARAGQALTPPAAAHVAVPWRYGFHATLKAPLRLAPHSSEDAWQQALATFAAGRQRFTMPPLQVAWLGDFLALRPDETRAPCTPLQALADDCVVQLDRHRAAPTPAERARHARPDFSAEQQALLATFGYPHVLRHWRFHMTLTGPLADWPADRAAALHAAACRHFAAALATPLLCDAICEFVEAAPGAPFELTRRFAFGR